MRLLGVAMVRDEADVIEAFVRHTLSVLDGLAIVDHGSLDGTSDILASLAAEGLPLFVTKAAEPGFFQELVHRRSFANQSCISTRPEDGLVSHCQAVFSHAN